MILNYLKLAFRHLLKHKLFSSIKLIGFIVGITSCLIIGLYLFNELSYDAMHENADRIVKVNMEYSFGGETGYVPVTGNKTAPVLKNNFPEIESAVRLMKYPRVITYGDVLMEEKDFYYADSSFFEIFSFPLVQGQAQNILKAPNEVVVTESAAYRYFGNENPIGKTIKVGSTDFTITGVMADPPNNTHIKPQFVGSFVSTRAGKPENEIWWSANYATYFLLQKPEQIPTLQSKVHNYMNEIKEEYGGDAESYMTYNLVGMKDVHFDDQYGGSGLEADGDKRYMYLLLAVALLILFIAVTTYINLTTAASTERAKAVGIHKVLGATKSQLAGQYFGEAMLVTFVALLLGAALTAPGLNLFNQIFDKELTAAPLFHLSILVGLLGFGLLVSLLAGFYPSMVVSNFKPVKVLKGQFKFTGSGTWLRKSLVVLQFGISIFLIICTLVLRQQMNFIQNKKLGYTKDQIVVLRTDSKVMENYDAIKNDLLQNPDIESVTYSYETPVRIDGGYNISIKPNREDNQPVTAIPVGEDFLSTLDMELASGQTFTALDIEKSQTARQDSLIEMPIIINESLAESFGFTAETAINQYFNFQGGRRPVKGVVKDFHFSSLHDEIKPLVIFPSTYGQVLLAKVSPNNYEQTLQRMERTWSNMVSHRPFAFHFMDEEFDRLYTSEIQTTKVVTSFSWLAIFLACLGLFGLASYSFVQRTKEIGVRKVLGASVFGIVGLLSKDFLKLVVVALVVASPLAWYLMNSWLNNFTYRIDIPWWVFLLAGVLAILIAFITVSLQSVKSALANPIESLRSE